MALRDTASAAMAYLDSVKIAADYKLTNELLTVITDDGVFNLKFNGCSCKMINRIKSAYPQKARN